MRELVKKVDELLPDHIGWRLWQAAGLWKERFAEGMVAAGHDWYSGARTAVIPYIAPTGTRQLEIVRKMGLTKQAVQQLIDDLVAEGVVERIPDPDDRRGKIVRFTEKGLAGLRDGVRIKQEVEAGFREAIGEKAFEQMASSLRLLIEGQGDT